MHPAWFKPTIPASERPQIHALDRAATEINDIDRWMSTEHLWNDTDSTEQ